MKLSGLTWFIVGLSVALVAMGFAYFQYKEPNDALAGFYTSTAEKLDIEIAKKKKAEERLKMSQQMVQERAKKWRETVAWRTPPTNVNDGGINLDVNSWQLTVDSITFRNNIQRAVNRQVRKGGVVVEQGPDIPSTDLNAPGILASYYNYPALPYPIVIFDLGQVVVRGNYSQITQNIRSWSTMPGYLAVADGLVVNGTSPNLVGTYNLSIVGYIRGTKIYPAVPEGAGAGVAPGAPAAAAAPPRNTQTIRKGGL